MTLTPGRHPHAPEFFLDSPRHHRDLHSFPTRRSSDLVAALGPEVPETDEGFVRKVHGLFFRAQLREEDHVRSEEHTSELQSHSDLVCRLLLEKKNSEVSR